MHAVLRQYTGKGAAELFDAIESHSAEVERVIREVPGFVSYTLFRTAGGGVSVTVCNDKAGTDESVKRAAQWIKENVKNVKASAPVVSDGDTIIAVSGKRR